MCGISGIINKNGLPVDRQDIKVMNDLIKHRGPNDEGFYYFENFAYGHRRLSILDLSDAGHQPMHFSDKYVLTYNGEIYNYIEIKSLLESMGYTFKTKTDTEVILAAYDKWGSECVSHFNGMWAFSLFDKEQKIIFCSRDRFGIKPFYYKVTEKTFIFGSEIKQLLLGDEPKYVNQRVLMDYLLASRLEHDEETFFEGIKRLQGGQNLIYNLSSNTFIVERYYELKKNPKISSLGMNDAIKLYSEELTRSISYRMRSDVKVGTSLSGGLDSSTIASIASKTYYQETGQKFSAITAKSVEKESDESHYAQAVVENSGMQWFTTAPDKANFEKYVDEVIRLQEEPFVSTSMVMQFFVFKRAKEAGCTVMLDGQGGDETLLGYSKYVLPLFMYDFKTNGLKKAVQNFKKSNANQGNISLKWFILFSMRSSTGWLKKLEIKKRFSFIHEKYVNKSIALTEGISSWTDIEKLQIDELERVSLPHLLRYEDRNSMYFSIESRLPFLDYKLVETAFSIQPEYKAFDGWSKYILRKVVEGKLPSNIIWRKTKFGFESPEKSWLGNKQLYMLGYIAKSKILNSICDIKLLIKSYDSLPLKLKWKLFNIARWEEMYDIEITV